MILDSGSVTFEVLDEGAGPPVGVDPFGKFERGTQGFETGLGLGLALVRAAAAAHGGEAWLRRRDDGGARAGFWVRR